MSQALETVARLARQVENGLPLGRGALGMDDAGDVTVTLPTDASHHHFFLDGLLFNVSFTPSGEETIFQIWAEVGYMPYSIESPQKRARLQAVLRATAGLTQARFVVDDKQKIIVLGKHHVQGHLTLTDLMHGIIQFIQEARPYLRVFGECL